MDTLYVDIWQAHRKDVTDGMGLTGTIALRLGYNPITARLHYLGLGSVPARWQ